MPALLEGWALAVEDEPLISSGGTVRFVRRYEEPLVLKVARPDEAAQGAALEHYAGEGAVRLLARDGVAMLMERAQPGRPLSALAMQGQDEAATRIIARLIGRLHRRPPPDHGFPTVEDWGGGFQRVRPMAVARGADAGLIDAAGALYQTLCASQGERFLLHGDLHHGNVLWDRGRGWLAIDPKGVVGELAYETGAMMRNPGQNPRRFADAQVIQRRAGQLSEALQAPAARILDWCFSQAVLAALWFVEDGGNAALAWEMARASRPLAPGAG